MPMFHERFEKFSNSIIKESEIEKELFVRSLVSEISRYIKNKQKIKLEDYENNINKAKEQFNFQKSKEIFKKNSESRKKLLLRRNQLFSEIESEIEIRIKNFINSEKYEPFLKESVKILDSQAYFLNDESKILIYCNFDHIDAIKRAFQNCKVLENSELEYKQHILLGGMILKTKKFIVDLSLDKKLELSKKKFFETGATIINPCEE